MIAILQAATAVPAPVATWQGLLTAGALFLIGNVALTTFVALAVFDRLIVRRLKSDDNTDSVDSVVMGALARREAQLGQAVNRVLSSRLDALDEKCSVAETNRDKLEAIEKIQELQSARLTRLESETRDMPRMIDALERIETAMEAMSRSMTETRDMVHTLKGEWDGTKRRATDR